MLRFDEDGIWPAFHEHTGASLNTGCIAGADKNHVPGTPCRRRPPDVRAEWGYASYTKTQKPHC